MSSHTDVKRLKLLIKLSVADKHSALTKQVAEILLAVLFGAIYFRVALLV